MQILNYKRRYNIHIVDVNRITIVSTSYDIHKEYIATHMTTSTIIMIDTNDTLVIAEFQTYMKDYKKFYKLPYLKPIIRYINFKIWWLKILKKL